MHPDELEINTLENAIYLSMHNDVSFIIDSRLSLYEHQSTHSPNLLLRYLFYVSDLYSNMIKDSNLYGSRRIMIPAPRFLIFYNGKEKRLEREVLELAITECIAEGILADFLTRYRNEAKKMSIYEYDEERQRIWDREEGKELGRKEGQKEGNPLCNVSICIN